MDNNRKKFERLRNLHLPQGHYAITGSGPLGIRNIRDINDVDIIVDQVLWKALEEQYEVSERNGLKIIALAEGEIEAISCSDHARILEAEMIDGLPFEPLERLIDFKRKMGREKDIADLKLIQKWKESK